MQSRSRHAATTRVPRSMVGPRLSGERVTLLRWLSVLGCAAAMVTAVNSQAAPRTHAVTGLKAPVQGLLDRNHYPKAGFPGVVRNYVVTTSWASLQPQSGGPIVHPNDIDRAIAIARERGMGLKLRVRAGIDAPDWAKRIGGDPVMFNYTSVTTKHAGQVAGTVGHFWLPQFGVAYADLQNKLAGLYDDVPEVRSVVVTRCQTIFSETYLRNTRDPRAAHRLTAAGFTRAQDDNCHAEQILAHRVWQHTRSEVAFNPYQAIQSNGSVKQDVAYTVSQMDYCREILGPRCILANYSISAARPDGKAYAEVYAHMEKLGAPIAFQTATLAKIGNWQKTLQWAISSGSSSVELPTGYADWSAAALGSFAGRLTANAVDVK